jgi:hypothetical protein
MRNHIDNPLSHTDLRQIPSDHTVQDQARLKKQLISAGLAANKNRIDLVTNSPLRAHSEPKSLPFEGSAHELIRLTSLGYRTQPQRRGEANTSSKLLLMELSRRLDGWLSDTSTRDQAAPTQGDAQYQREIARLVRVHWEHNDRRLHVNLDWEVEHFIMRCLGGDGDLDAVLTVTGDSCRAYGVTCRQYIEWQWGTVGLQVLQMISSLSSHGSQIDVPVTREILGLDLILVISGPARLAVYMRVRDTAESLPEFWLLLATSVVQAISWMASVFRIPKEGPPHCSSLRLPLDPSQSFNIKFDELTPALHSSSSCWHQLLPNTTVATGFPVRTREPGLDVEWGLMLDLAEVMLRTDLSKLDYPSLLEGGIFYSGVSTLLYPVSRSQDVITWHFDTSGKRAIPPADQFLRVGSEDEFTLALTHLVGFAPQSEIRLGTRHRNYARMRPVTGCIERGRPEVALDAFSTAFGKAPATVTVGLKVKFPSTLRATVNPQQRRYDDIVKKTKDQAVILYDCGHQRGAWLVPQLSVILDLVYYRMFKEQWGEPPKHAHACANGGAAAAEILRNPLVYLHKLSPILEDSCDFRIMDLVKEIYEAMLKRRILHEAPAGGSLMLHRERLHGWDLLEIADAPDQSFRREIEVHQTTSHAIAQYPSWLPLTQHIPVYLGQDLGHVISVGNQPLPMRHVKNREKCLVASVHTLQNLLRNRDECSDFHLDCELVWELPPSVASTFLGMTGVSKDPTSSKRIEHCLQRLQRSKDHMCTLRNERTTLCANGLVIFGPEDTKLSRFNELVDSLGIGALQVKD